MSYSLRAGSGRNVLILLVSCQQTCMTCTHSNGICHTGLLTACELSANLYILLCVQWKNSWWWTEEMSETCKVLFQKQIREISAYSWFYYENVATNRELRGRQVLSLPFSKSKYTCEATTCQYTKSLKRQNINTSRHVSGGSTLILITLHSLVWCTKTTWHIPL